MNIVTTRTYGPPEMRWSAYDDDSYDGAPDAEWPSNCLAHGPTELQAVYNYLLERGLDEELDAKEQALMWAKIVAEESEDVLDEAAKMADYFDDVLAGLLGPVG